MAYSLASLKLERSLGEGGSPVRPNERRRANSRELAGGAGVRFAFASFFEMR